MFKLSERICLNVVMICLLLFASRVGAAGNTWTASSGTSEWSDAANWSLQAVPTSADNALIRGNTGNGIWPVISEQPLQMPNGIWIGYSNASGIPLLTLGYQSALTTTNISVGYVADGRMEVEGGHINVGSGGLNLGSGNSDWGYSHGTLNIHAGRLETTHLRFGVYAAGEYQGGSGKIELLGGSLKVFNLEGLDTPQCRINIESGMLVITGNYTVENVESWVNSGKLVAYDGRGEIEIDHIGNLVITARETKTGSRVMYNDALINIDDLGPLTQSWLNDNCYIASDCDGADINGDGNVDIFDFAALSDLWMNRYYGLFVCDDGQLLNNGTIFSGIGVNYFDCFYAKIKNSANNMDINGFQGLKDHKIKFARMMGCGFWPVDMQLYFDDKAEYFRRFDEVVNSALLNNVGLIPTLFWTHYTIADIVGEPVNSIGNPGSQTIAVMKQYVHDVVGRYKDSPAIWGWEIGNEWSNAIDLPNAADQRPPTWTSLGNPATRTDKDELTLEMMRTAMVTVAREIRKYDTYRLISSGNSYPRKSAWHQWTENSWTEDTTLQKKVIFKLHNPDPVNSISVHYYDVQRDLVLAQSVAQDINKPLFVGEFGANGYTQETVEQFNLLMDNIQSANVPFSAVWNYNRDSQSDDYNIVPDTYDSRYYQLLTIYNANN
jgi:hypothetical protein